MTPRPHNKIGGRSLRMERCEDRCVLSANSLGIASLEVAWHTPGLEVEYTVSRPLAESAFLSTTGTLGLTAIDSNSSLVSVDSYTTAPPVTFTGVPVAPTNLPSAGRESIARNRIVAIARDVEDGAAPGLDAASRLGSLGLLGESLVSPEDIKPQIATFDVEEINVIDVFDFSGILNSAAPPTNDTVEFDSFRFDGDSDGFAAQGGGGFEASNHGSSAEDPTPDPPALDQPAEPTADTAPADGGGPAGTRPAFLGPLFLTPSVSTTDPSGTIIVDQGAASSQPASTNYTYGPYQLTADELAAELVLARDADDVGPTESTSSIEDLTEETEPTNDQHDATAAATSESGVASEQGANPASTRMVEVAAGEGAIDLASLLVEATPRVIVARSDAESAAAERVAAVDTAARDAALAMESWTRSVRPLNPLQPVSLKVAGPAAIARTPLQSGSPIELAERTGDEAAAPSTSRRDASPSESTGSRDSFWTYAISTLLGGAVVWMSRRPVVEDPLPTEERPRRDGLTRR